MTTIPQNEQLLKELKNLVQAQRPFFKQERVYQKLWWLLLAELFAFGRHTVTQLLCVLGLTKYDWSRWYRFWNQGQFPIKKAQEQLLKESLKHVSQEELYVVAGDGTQTWRTGKTIEGTGWLKHVRTPPFKVGIHKAQRWFNGAWLMPQENGYSRAMPLKWIPAFTQKAIRQISEACKEWEAALQFLHWLKVALQTCGRANQKILMVADGSYDNRFLWSQLPAGIILLARSAKNRALYHLLTAAQKKDKRRKYGKRALTPQKFWEKRDGWKRIKLLIRGRERRLSYRVEGPFLRFGLADTPLFLIIVRGQKYKKGKRLKYRRPVPYLVNAVFNQNGQPILPLPAETLIFWAWQRWEIEVCHRELKSNLGLGHKQCFSPLGAILSVQWSAWVYSILLLAGYRTWGLTGNSEVPTSWWRGSGRWSFNTLWRAYRSAFWGAYQIQPLSSLFSDNLPLFHTSRKGLNNSAYFSSRL